MVFLISVHALTMTAISLTFCCWQPNDNISETERDKYNTSNMDGFATSVYKCDTDTSNTDTSNTDTTDISNTDTSTPVSSTLTAAPDEVHISHNLTSDQVKPTAFTPAII